MHLIHSLLVLLFSFGHAQSAAHSQADAFVPPPQDAAATFEAPIPSHHEILSGNTTSYAGAECPGCRTTIVTSSTR